MKAHDMLYDRMVGELKSEKIVAESLCTSNKALESTRWMYDLILMEEIVDFFGEYGDERFTEEQCYALLDSGHDVLSKLRDALFMDFFADWDTLECGMMRYIDDCRK